MLREHRGSSQGNWCSKLPTREHRPHFADVLQLPVRLRGLLRAGFGYEEGVPALPVSVSERGTRSPALRWGKVGLFVTFH